MVAHASDEPFAHASLPVGRHDDGARADLLRDVAYDLADAVVVDVAEGDTDVSARSFADDGDMSSVGEV